MQNPVMFYNVKNQPLGWLIHWFSKSSSFCNRGICSLYVFTVTCTTEAWPLRLRHLGILINTRSWIQVINRRLRCFKKYILRLVFSISFFFFAVSASDCFLWREGETKRYFQTLNIIFCNINTNVTSDIQNIDSYLIKIHEYSLKLHGFFNIFWEMKVKNPYQVYRYTS